jgi:hypothetical protein
MGRKLLFKLTCLITRVALLLAGISVGIAQDRVIPGSPNSRLNRQVVDESELTRMRADVILKIKETRANAERLLGLHEKDRQSLLEEYERRRKLSDQGLIARTEALQAEQAMAKAEFLVEEDRRRLAEIDMAITEAVSSDELHHLPGLALGGYGETAALLRFNGGTPWSRQDVPKLERFYFETFGRTLPISASGQTATHDRLKFDHRNAIDVALHPDSAEGRTLLGYLRQAGIPFMAFRTAVPGAATGAHIHIGRASSRN